MSRNLTTTLTATAVLGLAGTAFGQSPVASYNAPNLDMVPTVSTQGAFNITVTGDADGDTITTMVQVFFIPGDGATGPTAIGGLLLVDDGTGAGADGNAIDVDEDGTYGDALTDTDTDGFNVDLSLIQAATLTQLEANITAARAAAGASGEVFLQFTFTDAGDDAQTTENPTTYTSSTGVFTAAGTHESPVVLDGDLTISNAFDDSDNTALILEFPVPVGPVGTNTNGTVVANVTAADLEIDDADDFAGAAAPSALDGGTPNAVLGGSDNQTLTFNFDTSGMNIPDVGDFVRATGTDIEDSFGRLANADTDGVVITGLVEFAVDSVKWLQKVAPNGANVTDALAVTFTLPVDAGNVGDADFYNMIFMGETFNNATTDLVRAGGFVITNIAVDTTVDATGATVVIDVDSDNDSLGVAANGNNDDGDTGTDIGTFDADADGDETQNVFQLVTNEDDGTQPMSTLGTDYLGADDSETETTTIGDCISPTITAVAFLDTDSDGVIDTIAGVADESLADSTSTAGFTLQALDAGMVQPFSMIDMTTGALPDPIELEFDMDMDEELDTFTVSIGSVDPDLANDGPSALESNNAVMLTGFSMDIFGDNLPGTGDANIFDLAYDMATGDIEDANGNDMDDLAATNASLDRAAPVLSWSLHLGSENIPTANLTDSNVQCFAEPSGNASGNDIANRAVFYFSESMTPPSNAEAGNITVDGTLLSSGGNPTVFGDDAVLTTPDFTNAVTVIDGTIGDDPGDAFTIPATADMDDTAGNNFTGAGTLVDGTDPFLSRATDVNGVTCWSAFLVDTDDDDFANQILLVLNGAIDSTLLDDTAEQTAQAANFSVTGFSFTPSSLTQDADNGNILLLEIEDGLVSMTSTATVTYDGSDADPLLTGGAKDSSFDAKAPATPDLITETPFVMAFTGNITLGGSPVPVGTQICAMVAVPTVRSIRADKDGVTFRYDRSDIEQEEIETDNSDNIIQRSLEDFTNFLLGLEERMYVICDEFNLDIYSNTKFFVEKDGDSLDDEEAFEYDPDSYPAQTVIDLDVNASNLDRISFSGRSGSGSATRSVSSGTVQLCYDVLRSDGGTYEDLFRDGYCIDGDPIVSKAVVTDTTGGYSLYVSLPNLEASDSDDGMSNDSNIFATANLPVVILVITPDGVVYPASGLVNNINGTGPLLFSSEILSQTSDGEASGATTFNMDLDNVGNTMAYNGYNLVGFPRASGFARASNSVPVLPDGVTEDDVRVGASLLPPAGPEDQFVWWADDGDGVFESNEVDDIIVDNNCITSFPFIISSAGVQLGTNGVNAIVGGYSFGLFVDDTYGLAQFGAPLAEDGIFTTNEFPNSSSNRGWAFVTVTQDFATMDDFFNANPDVDFVILFNRTSVNDVEVSSASPAGGPVSGNDLTELSDGDTIIIHTNN